MEPIALAFIAAVATRIAERVVDAIIDSLEESDDPGKPYCGFAALTPPHVA